VVPQGRVVGRAISRQRGGCKGEKGGENFFFFLLNLSPSLAD